MNERLHDISPNRILLNVSVSHSPLLYLNSLGESLSEKCIALLFLTCMQEAPKKSTF